jgi:hypothetical protein
MYIEICLDLNLQIGFESTELIVVFLFVICSWHLFGLFVVNNSLLRFLTTFTGTFSVVPVLLKKLPVNQSSHLSLKPVFLKVKRILKGKKKVIKNQINFLLSNKHGIINFFKECNKTNPTNFKSFLFKFQSAVRTWMAVWLSFVI